ncbi:hypothetical protein ACF0H5_022001 [Mactra antiquata]
MVMKPLLYDTIVFSGINWKQTRPLIIMLTSPTKFINFDFTIVNFFEVDVVSAMMLFRVGFLLYAFLRMAHSQPYAVRDTLRKDLLSNYSTDLLPLVDQSGTVNVLIKFTVYAVTELNPVKGFITMTVGFVCQWTDEMLKWNSSEHDGVRSILFRPEEIWLPSISAVSSLDQTMIGQGTSDKLRVYNNGLTQWNTVHVISVVCSFYMKFWPFDKQVCEILMLVKDDFVSDVKMEDNGSLLTTVDRVTLSEWSVEEISVKNLDSPFVSAINYEIKFRRHPEFYVLTLVLPVTLLGLLQPFVFLLPSGSGERIGFAITIMLSLTVFLTVISDEIPRTTNPVALICGYVMLLTVSSFFVTVASIVSLRYFHGNNNKDIGTFWRMCLGWRHMIKRNKISDQELNNVITVDNQTRVADAVNDKHAIVDIEDALNDHFQEERNAHGHKEELSWEDVSKLIDRYLFIITFVTVSCSSIVFICYLYLGSDYDPSQ